VSESSYSKEEIGHPKGQGENTGMYGSNTQVEYYISLSSYLLFHNTVADSF
jgi:hypothetical protein